MSSEFSIFTYNKFTKNMKKQTYLENERFFAVYMYNKMRKSNVNLQLGYGSALTDGEILEMYDIDIEFKEFINTQYILKKEKDKLRRRNAYLKIIENNDKKSNALKRAKTIGKEGLKEIRAKGRITLGPDREKEIGRKAKETFNSKPDEFKKDVYRRIAENRDARAANIVRAKNLGKEKLSEIAKKGRQTLGKEGMSNAMKLAQNFITEFSDGNLTKGTKSRANYAKNNPDLIIIKKIRIDDFLYSQYLEKWNKQMFLKKENKKKNKLSASEAHNSIIEWSDGELTKGSKSKSKKIKEGYIIINKISPRDKNYKKYEENWKKISLEYNKKMYDLRLKSVRKGTKGNDSKVICPDGHETTAASATVYCRNRGLDRSKCIPVK